jgi:hypothetical protein
MQIGSSIGVSAIISGVLMVMFTRWLNAKDAKNKVQETEAKAKQEVKEAEEKSKQTEQATIKDGILALLHDRIYSVYEECDHKGYAAVEDIRNLEYLYNPYHALGGNGTGTELFERVKKMPDYPAERGTL